MNIGDDLTDSAAADGLRSLEDDIEIDGLPEDEADGCGDLTATGSNHGQTLPQDRFQGAQLEVLRDEESTRKVVQEEEEEPLECPRCLASFSIDRHVDLLEHINRCLE